MEKPPSLNDYIEETGIPEEFCVMDYDLLVWAYQKYLKKQREAEESS